MGVPRRRDPLVPPSWGVAQAFNRLHIDSMGTPKTYERYGKENGYEMIEYSEMTENMKTHYQLVSLAMTFHGKGSPSPSCSPADR